MFGKESDQGLPTSVIRGRDQTALEGHRTSRHWWPVRATAYLDIIPRDWQVHLMNFPDWERLSVDPLVMGGKPCIRGTRVTVGTLVGLVASGASITEILGLYPYVTEPDVRTALAYAAWRAEEREVPPDVRVCEDERSGLLKGGRKSRCMSEA